MKQRDLCSLPSLVVTNINLNFIHIIRLAFALVS